MDKKIFIYFFLNGKIPFLFFKNFILFIFLLFIIIFISPHLSNIPSVINFIIYIDKGKQ